MVGLATVSSRRLGWGLVGGDESWWIDATNGALVPQSFSEVKGDGLVESRGGEQSVACAGSKKLKGPWKHESASVREIGSAQAMHLEGLGVMTEWNWMRSWWTVVPDLSVVQRCHRGHHH